MISNFPVTIKITPRFNVVNIKSFAVIGFCDPASLASEAIALPGFFSLFAPICAASVIVTAKPSGAILARHIPRLSLPIQSTFNTTKNIFLDPLWQSLNRLTAIITMIFFARKVLRMILAAWSVIFTIFRHALPRTKGRIKSFHSVFLSSDQFTTIYTGYLLTGALCCIAAISRTIFLIAVITGRLEQFTTMFAGFFDSLAVGFPAAGPRAKPYNSISSFFNWFSANFTSFHTVIIP